jgi:hypothetical protein
LAGSPANPSERHYLTGGRARTLNALTGVTPGNPRDIGGVFDCSEANRRIEGNSPHLRTTTAGDARM